MKEEPFQKAMCLPLSLLDGYLHPSLEEDEELARRGRFQIRFGVLGGTVAIVYSAFFFAVEHFWGGCIVAVSGITIMQLPLIVKKTGNLTLTGHLYGAVLLFGFSALCAVSGGLQGYAQAWLAAVPLCALMLMDLRGALIWSGITFVTVVAFSAYDISGQEFLKIYESDRESSIEAASHIGLLIFLSLLGLLFEQTRIDAFDRLRVVNSQLAGANKDLTDLNKQKNEFLNIAAHDLKNPLTIICGYADLLSELESPTLKQIRDQSAEILKSGNHMLDIIANILNVRAIEDGQIKLKRIRCGTQEIIESLVVSYGPAAKEKEISLVFPSSDDPAEAWADPGSVQQVVDNILSNAIKYTPPGGSVTIRQSISDNNLVIEVADTGPGLSKDDQQLLWTKFVRLTPRPTGGEGSNGLGLWIVRRLAEEMGGSAFCRSALRQGSIFGVALPLWADQEESEDSPSHEQDAQDFEKLVRDIGFSLTEDREHEVDAEDIGLPS